MCGILTFRNINKLEQCSILNKFELHRRGFVDKFIKLKKHNIQCYFQRLPLVHAKDDTASSPFVTENGNVIILFNGELYNYGEVSSTFRSEVDFIAKMYTYDKRTLFYLSLLKGEYVYVIIDVSRQLVIVHRAFPGVVSLYGYFTRNGKFIISSEKLYEKQKQFEPGVLYVYNYRTGKLKKIQRMYDYLVDIRTPPPVPHFNNLFHKVLTDYITHKDDDIKITMSYSGGVDSSYVLFHCLYDEDLRKHITQIVTCQYSGTPEYEQVKSNLKFIKKKFGINYVLIDLHKFKPDSIKHKLVRRLQVDNNPIKLRSAIRNYYVAQFSVNPIIIGGEGADELFGGYPQFIGTNKFTFKRKQVETLYSMKAINLDRTNNVPFEFNKEWRVPFLDNRVIVFALQHSFEYGKGYLKQALKELQNYDNTLKQLHVFTSKYGNEEKLSEQYLNLKSHDLERIQGGQVE